MSPHCFDTTVVTSIEYCMSSKAAWLSGPVSFSVQGNYWIKWKISRNIRPGIYLLVREFLSFGSDRNQIYAFMHKQTKTKGKSRPFLLLGNTRVQLHLTRSIYRWRAIWWHITAANMSGIGPCLCWMLLTHFSTHLPECQIHVRPKWRDNIEWFFASTAQFQSKVISIFVKWGSFVEMYIKGTRKIQFPVHYYFLHQINIY